MTEPAPRRPRVAPAAPAVTAPPEPAPPELPYLLDFLPRESDRETRLSKFFERLKEGQVATTRCPKDDLLLWPPRTVCPKCHTEELEWVDLPSSGQIYAFSAVLAGAPLGMEGQLPFAVGLVDLDGVPLRLFGRIEGRPWTELAVGQKVELEPYRAPDGRVFYRFRAEG